MAKLTTPPRYQVFLSSTYDDLREERQQATQAILEMGHFPAGMELFPASDQTQADLIKRVISESDYYVLILSARYGSTDLSGLSYTEMEYNWAIEYGLPILSFVRRSIEDVPTKWAETDSTKRSNLEAFRAKVMSRHVRLFDNSTELGMQVMKSLMNESRINPRVGWIRADQIPTALDVEAETQLRAELKASKKDIVRLERALRDRQRVPDDLWPEALAQGTDLFELRIMYQNKNKQQEAKVIALTWDDIFSVIAPSMYGYIQRRFSSGYNQPEAYKFENDLIDFVRVRNLGALGVRAVKLLSHEIDTIMIQFQQLGYVIYAENGEDDDKKPFRGYTLTEEGEAYLTKIKLKTRA